MRDEKNFVIVKGARTNNLKNIDVKIPRDSFVVFTGVSGSGKSSLAFGTLYAEAQRRYLESVSPFARRLINQLPVPEVDDIVGLPPAIALQQQRTSGNVRSSVGSITTISNLLRILYSRAGIYPEGQEIIYAEGFSPNTPEGACPNCHGLGTIYEATEQSMVPNSSLTIREKAIAAWPSGWAGQNQRDILTSMGYDIDLPWRDLPQKTRDWLLFTDEQPEAPVYPGKNLQEVKEAIKSKIKPNYMGKFTSARRYLLHTFKHSESALMRKRVSQYMVGVLCPVCKGKKLNKESLSVTFAGLDIAEMMLLPMNEINEVFLSYSSRSKKSNGVDSDLNKVVTQIADDLLGRLQVILELGLGYLTLERTAPTLSGGELQRLRLATQIRSNLFGVTYVLDEPSAGLHPGDTQALLQALDKLKNVGNSLFIVEHEVDVIRHADWIVDIGPEAGEFGGQVIYSGDRKGFEKSASSVTSKYLFHKKSHVRSERKISHWLTLSDVTKNNLSNFDVSIPLGSFTTVSGVSGSGKSTLISQAMVELVKKSLGFANEQDFNEEDISEDHVAQEEISGNVKFDKNILKRLVVVDQKPIGRSPRSNLATYTGIFDNIRKLFAETPVAKKRKYNAGRFSFNVGDGRCQNCKGEGMVMVELMFLPNVYSKCPVCKGTRYNDATLEIIYKEKNIAEVLRMTADQAYDFFDDTPVINKSLEVIKQVGLGYLKLGQSATELSGGEAQRLKLANELQKVNKGDTLYVLDEPTTGLHPSDVEKLLAQLNALVDLGNTVIVVEHDMDVLAQSDWIIDIGPGAGAAGGKIVAEGKPEKIINSENSKTGVFLKKRFANADIQ